MLLGQVMQASTGIAGAATDPSLSKLAIRQCKLTELLFSNAFHQAPSSLTLQQPRPQQQKAIMIVTADPRGDYNATSQILKYSALAKETTVPRILSVSSTILPNTSATMAPPTPRQPSFMQASHHSHMTNSVTESANTTISRLTTELANLRNDIHATETTLASVTSSWNHAEERLEQLEAEIRDECWNSFEAQLAEERERWRAAWENERENNVEHVDRKVEVLVRGISTVALEETQEVRRIANGDDQEKGELWTRVEELEQENQILKMKVLALEREKVGRTPSRKVKVLKARPWNVDEVENLSP